ncbi:MAG: bifunctional (p)ppGpp synthetase/guanosine-3',5'-bis(diphosphate) 3'-pyrophosphohydrolase [Ruminococcaceae bacterium]|nr:bifunctional (p)ppGpp synthetase/guanosine-3',5'-bis(diphosphate) 3'-pyrophosphohydrolase [Oscillospiraceae bacterium]
MDDKSFEALVGKVQSYNPKIDIEKLKKAYELADKAHDGQLRNTGEPYIIHPLAVAHILADLELDCDSLVGALLHDVVEDTDCTVNDVSKEFGDSVGIIVDGVTKLSKIQYTNKEDQQIENLRKMFLAMAKDIRVILIKLADRLHNMRTLKAMSEDKQREKARETLEVYAALAHRLGMSKIKWELEDLSLRYLDPIAYREITESISQKRKEREQYIEDIIETFRQKLAEIGISAQLMGRAKHFYSIFRKMYAQNKSIDEIYDLFAVRAIVDSVKDCYAVLGMVHELYYPIPGRFKDYIAMPKPNMYQSLHTTVMGPSGIPFEVQIRTKEMHKIAEFGIAAHWKYKEGTSGQSDMDEKLEWIGKILEIQNETVDSDDFMRTLKIDLFADEVFVFTPKGDVINLPAGSTPIDFAFAIHSAVGCRMAGVKVNGKIATLDYNLQNGDIVEIMTSSAMHGPSRDWLKICKTSQARTKINQWFKKERREDNILRGKDMIEKELKRIGISHSQLFKPEWIEKLILKKYGFHTEDDMYAAVGFGGLTVNKVLSRLKEEYRLTHKDEAAVLMPTASSKKKKSSGCGIVVEGIENCLVRLSRCCNPVPGDNIVGYITRGRGVSVHRADCPNIKAEEKSSEGAGRLMKVYWEEACAGGSSYLTELQVASYDRQGLLAEITGMLYEMKIPLSAVHTKITKEQIAYIYITIEVNSKEQLEIVVKKLSHLGGVFEVTRNNA